MVSPDFGDLRFPDNLLAYREGVISTCRKERFVPRLIAHDLHPEYATTILVPSLKKFFKPTPDLRSIQHHHAHLASVMMEKDICEPVIGIIWDGSGYGQDSAIWGGEFFIGTIKSFQRSAHLEYIPMPGGEKAIEEPWRMAVAYLHRLFGKNFLDLPLAAVKKMDQDKVGLLLSMIEKKINCPLTSSMGRLFDAASALAGTGWINHYPAESARELERKALEGKRYKNPYSFNLNRFRESYVIELNPFISEMIKDIRGGSRSDAIAGRFHATVIEIGLKTARVLAEESGSRKVILSGGVFFNRIIREGMVNSLKKAGLNPILPEYFSVGDESLAVGQAVIAHARK